MLNGVYTVEAELGHGGVGIVYLAKHRELGPVAIKEYLPTELVVREGQSVHPVNTDSQGFFEEGLDRFLGEAKQLIRFRTHPSIVSCRDFFRANGTAYLVMDLEEGMSLSELLQAREAEGRPFDETDLLTVMVPLLEGLDLVHAAGVLHRDIKPANILIRREDNHPVLIDFGAAKQEFAQHSKSLAPFSPGYAAIEQVAEGRLGTWTDMYGIGAVMWRMVAGGNRPYEPLHPVRVERRAHARFRGEPDPMPSAQTLGKGRFSQNILAAIDQCLELREKDRVQGCKDMLQWLREARRPASGIAEVPVKTRQAAERQPVSHTAPNSKERHKKAIPAKGRHSANVKGKESVRYLVLFPLAGLCILLLLASLVDLIGTRQDAQNFPSGLSASDVDSLRQAAEQGDPKAQFGLGFAYATGEGVPEDDREAVKWYRMAAEQGDPKAQFGLGFAYATGEGVPEDDREAVKWYRMAAEQGDPKAQFGLGFAYATGEGVPEDDREAVKWYRMAAEQGDPKAQFGLGFAYATGEGVPEDDREAVKWYRMAAEQGLANAQVNLGAAYANGMGVPEDDREAVKWFRMAAEQGDASAQFNLGLAYTNGMGVPQDDREAVKWFRMAAEQGLADAQFNLGFMYANGMGLSEDDREAVKWFRMAAEQGLADAQGSLGFAYANGMGVPEDDREAVKWFRIAAEQGLANAQFNLGFMYANGTGVPENDREAVKWYRMAAEQGDASAQFNLGLAYTNGEGVPQDNISAYAWMSLAAINIESVRAHLVPLRLRMTADQVDRAQRLSSELFRDIESGDLKIKSTEEARATRSANPSGRSEGRGGDADLVAQVQDQPTSPAKTLDTIAIQESTRTHGLSGAAAVQTTSNSSASATDGSNTKAANNANPGASFFTRGSHADDVLRIQGTPTAINTYEALGKETWRYGYSTVEISLPGRRVIDWDNSQSNLKVQMQPGRNVTSTSFFTRGSHADDVLRIQGTPTAINTYEALGKETWRYGYSTVEISLPGRRVIDWDNSQSNLKVQMQPGRNVTSTSFFTRGSHADDVLRIQGTPTAINTYGALGKETWRYGYSTVEISLPGRRVIDWDNSQNNLKVQMQPGTTR